MDNIKRSVSNLIKHKSSQSSQFDNNHNEDSGRTKILNDAVKDVVIMEPIDRSQGEDRKLPLNNPHREREVMESIENVYFSDDSLDCSDYELKKFADLTDLNSINERRKCMKEQLAVTTKKIFNYILENYPSYSAELTKVMELKESIETAYNVCQQSRRHLSRAESVLTVAAFTSISKNRKRLRLMTTLEVLTKIKMLQSTDLEIRRMLEEEDVANAIRLCSECTFVAELYKEYACISDLTKKLKATLADIEARLDNVLAECTLNFETERFSRAVSAYSMLGRTQNVPDRVVELVTCAVKDTCSSVIHMYSRNKVDKMTSVDDLERYAELCKTIDSDTFLPCYRELLKLTWKILHSYHGLISWASDNNLPEFQEFASLFKTALMANVSSLWETAAFRFTMLIDNVSDLTAIKFSHFVHFLKLTSSFIEIGINHFCCQSVRFQDSVRRLSLKYLEWHHKACLFELKQFLATETWTRVPVDRHFTFKHLPEFAFANTNKPNLMLVSDDQQCILMNPSLCNPYSSSDSINESPVETLGSHDETSDSDSEQRDASARKFSIHQNGTSKVDACSFKSVVKLPPYVSNSALSLLRLLGRYLEISWIFNPVAFELITMLSQLFEFYLYVVYKSFALDQRTVYGDFVRFTSDRLKCVLSRLEAKYSNTDHTFLPGISTDEEHTSPDQPAQSLLADRILIAESTIFIAKQLEGLKCIMESVLPASRITLLQQFFSQVVSCVDDIRAPIYVNFCLSVVQVRYLLTAVESTNWDIQDLMTQHSPYVSLITADYDNYLRTIQQTHASMPVPRESFDVLLLCWIRVIFRTLVEGYSSAKKCTNQGRALMQLDFQHLLLQLETLASLKPIPDKEYVDVYIKAYYLPESSIEENITSNVWADYSNKQIAGLINVAGQITKRTKTKLLTLLESPTTTPSFNPANLPQR